MNINLKKEAGELSQEDMNRVNEVFENGCPYEGKSVNNFFEFVKSVKTGFEELSSNNKKIKAYLRLWKGISKKFYQEIIPFKSFLDRIGCPWEYKVQISDNSSHHDAILSNGVEKWIFEIVTAYIDKQEIYRTHHLNTNGWVGGNRTYIKERNGDLVANNELEMIETTPGKDVEALEKVISSIGNAVHDKQEKKYEDTYLIVVTGCSAIFNKNQYAVDRVQQELMNMDNKTFKNIYVLDYELPHIIKLSEKKGTVLF